MTLLALWYMRIPSQSSPVCKLWIARHLLSKWTGSLTSHCDIVFSGYKVPRGLGARIMHPALGESSSKPCLLNQDPFKTFLQNVYIFRTSSLNVYKFCLIKIRSGEWRKVVFVSSVFGAKLWAGKEILVGKRIIFQLLRSSEFTPPLSSMQFWT